MYSGCITSDAWAWFRLAEAIKLDVQALRTFLQVKHLVQADLLAFSPDPPMLIASVAAAWE
jgi:hypothetical protein